MYYGFQQKFETFTNPINCVMPINKNSESLQNATPTCNTSSFPEKDFLSILFGPILQYLKMKNGLIVNYANLQKEHT